MVLGAVGILALSGSQVWNHALASGADPNAEQGSLTIVPSVDPSTPSLPLPTAYPTPSSGLPTGTVAPSPTSSPSGPYGLNSSAALTASGIPEAAHRAYVAAAAELARTDPSCRLSWPLIAGIGRVESNHGRYGGSSINADGMIVPPILGIRLDGSRAGTARIGDSDGGRYDGDTAFDRAVGPMQFLPGTWESYGGGANPQNMNAAALAAARYLCAGSGSLDTQQGRWAAVYRYNHSNSYVSLVLSLADSYASGKAEPFPDRPDGTPPPPASEQPATNPGPPPAVPTPPVTTPPSTTAPTGKPTPNPTRSTPAPPTIWPTPTPPTSPASPPTIWPTPTAPADPTTGPEPPTTEPAPPTTEPSPTPSDTCAPVLEPNPSPTPTATPDPNCPDVEATLIPTAAP